jgi:hypothetical protein
MTENMWTYIVFLILGFENSALKMSFSLSSLQPSSGSLESPEHAKLRAERPYNSLTKKPRYEMTSKCLIVLKC